MRILLLLAAATLTVSLQGDDKNELGYYENLALLGFTHGMFLYDALEPKTDKYTIPTKRDVARKLSFQAFGYFVHLQEGLIQPSERVERMIKNTYKGLSLEDRECFSDPLLRNEDFSGKISITGTQPIETEERYSMLVKEFFSHFEFTDHGQ